MPRGQLVDKSSWQTKIQYKSSTKDYAANLKIKFFYWIKSKTHQFQYKNYILWGQGYFNSISFLKTVTVPVAICDSFLPCPFYSTHIPKFTVLDPLLGFTNHLLFSWRKFALCIQSLLCMLFLFGWPPCQRSDMILMEVSQHAYDMIHYISGLFGYFYVCEIYVDPIWYLYLFMLNKFWYDLNGGLPTCLWYDSLYIRIIWLLLCLWNLCKPDMVPVSIYVE